MAVLCRPAVAVPEHVITLEETLELCRRLHSEHSQLELALRLIRNTNIAKRHLVRPIEEILHHPGFEERNACYVAEARKRVPQVVETALQNAGIGASAVDAVIYVSCTGFTMPSMTAWMINNLGLPTHAVQLPIAQLGCAAGGAAINRAHDFCLAYPGANVLIVACEFCSLCYQPTDLAVGNLLSNGLFGDAIAAVVVRGGADIEGLRLERNASYLVPGTERWISYDVKATGFHFVLDRRVPGTMAMLAPSLASLAAKHGWEIDKLDSYAIHAGGPRILDDLCAILEISPDRFAHSRATLNSYGNIASVTVIESLRRMFDDPAVRDGDRAVIAGFGPGITAELALGTWQR